MGFDEATRSLLELYSSDKRGPLSGDKWYGPWIMILTSLFPAAEGYVIEPRLCGVKPGQCSLPDVILSVVKISREQRLSPKPLLIVQCRTGYQWDTKVHYFEKLVERRMQDFCNTRNDDLAYWIMAVGPHWRYGKTINEEMLEVAQETMIPLIDWQDTVHDETSYDHLCSLQRIIKQLDSY